MPVRSSWAILRCSSVDGHDSRLDAQLIWSAIMARGASTESRRSWRSVPSGTLVRRSRHLWRWLLSGLALLFIIAAILFAFRQRPQTLLFVLTGSSSGRDERTVLPLVPFVEDDRDALMDWAAGAKIPVCVEQLTDIEN